MTTTTKQIRAALDAATPGPWEELYYDGWQGITSPDIDSPVLCVDQDMKTLRISNDDMKVLSNSRDWLAWLIGEVARRDALLRRYQETRHGHGGRWDGSPCDCDLCASARKMRDESE